MLLRFGGKLPIVLPHTIFVTNKTNIRYLCGFSGTAGYLLLHGEKGFLFTDARYHLVAKAVLPKGFSLIDITIGLKTSWQRVLKNIRMKVCGFEGNNISVQFLKKMRAISSGVRFVDIGTALDTRRIQKKSWELRLLCMAQSITDRIFCHLKKNMHVGMSEKEIAWNIEVLAHQYGADDLSFPPIIALNEHSASPHHNATDRRLKHGDIILIDMGVIYKGYCSDMTRVLFTKKPTDLQLSIYHLVHKAQEAGIKKLHAGITGNVADGYARDVIAQAGYGAYFGHSLGHGVGLDIHELPNLAQKYDEPIPKNAVVTIEPGVYLPGRFGVRLEDMVIVENRGVRIITASPKAIHECMIRLK